MKGLKLTKETGVLDVQFIKGRLQMVEGDEGNRQNLEFKYEFFQNDWMLDLSFGIPYYGAVLGVGFNAQELFGIFERAALEESYVESVETLDIQLDNITRRLTVTGTVLAKSGVSIPIAVSTGVF